MNRIFYSLIIMIVSIGHSQAGADERAVLYSTRSSSGIISDSGPVDIPPWAVHIADNSFVGISKPCSSIEEARQQALDSAIGQILQAMGADYHLSHESTLSGDLNQSRYELKERLSYSARWLLNSVQHNIRQYAFQRTGNGHVCFVLVRMKPSELEKLKRLTIGAKVTARLLGTNGDHVSVEISESNGVGVTITEYRLTTAVRHQNARLITLFLWKVPETDNSSYEGALPHRLSLKDSSSRTTIPITTGKCRLTSIFMGSKEDFAITLMGYDELGRSVSTSVKIP